MGIDNSVNTTKIDLAVLKRGFKEYLEDKQIADEISGNKSSSSGSSIFMHNDEFKNYLVEEIGLNESVLSQDISTLLNAISDGSILEDENGEVNEDAIDNIEQMESEQEAEDNPQTSETSEDADISNAESNTAQQENNPINPDDFSSDLVNTEDSFMLQALNEALADAEVMNTFDIDGSGELSQEEIDKFLEASNTDENTDELSFDEISNLIKGLYVAKAQNEMLDEIFNNKDVINLLDLDGDGKLSDAEKDKFKEFITGYANDGDELSLDDIEKAFNDILDGKFDYSEIKPNDVKDESNDKVDDIKDDKIKTDETKDSAVSSLSPTKGSSNVSGGGGNYWSGGGSYNAGSVANVPKTLDNMTLEELEQEKVAKQKDVDDAQKEVDSINSGEKFKAEEENVKKLEDEYKLALENDKNTPPELLQCIEDIDNKEEDIKNTKISISELNTQVFEQNNVVNSVQATLDALLATQTKLNSATSDDSEKQAEINQKKTDIEQKIQEVKQQLEEQQGALTELENQKKDKETDLSKFEGELVELNNQKNELEQQVKENCSQETKAAMEAYNEAKTKLETDKSAAETQANDKLKAAQTELQKVNDKINEKKAQQTAKEYSVYNSTLPDEVAEVLDNKLGSGFTEKLESICEKLKCEPEALLGIMASESGINPSIVNPSSGSTGLIQFMPSVAASLGTSTSALAKMSGVEQLDYVEKCMLNAKATYFGDGEMSAGDLYSIVWLPAYCQRDVLVSAGERYYSSALDLDGDGRCSKADLTQRIENKYKEWLGSVGLSY